MSTALNYIVLETKGARMSMMSDFGCFSKEAVCLAYDGCCDRLLCVHMFKPNTRLRHKSGRNFTRMMLVKGETTSNGKKKKKSNHFAAKIKRL